jgi:hypothetical protein
VIHTYYDDRDEAPSFPGNVRPAPTSLPPPPPEPDLTETDLVISWLSQPRVIAELAEKATGGRSRVGLVVGPPEVCPRWAKNRGGMFQPSFAISIPYVRRDVAAAQRARAEREQIEAEVADYRKAELADMRYTDTSRFYSERSQVEKERSDLLRERLADLAQRQKQEYVNDELEFVCHPSAWLNKATGERVSDCPTRRIGVEIGVLPCNVERLVRCLGAQHNDYNLLVLTPGKVAAEDFTFLKKSGIPVYVLGEDYASWRASLDPEFVDVSEL